LAPTSPAQDTSIFDLIGRPAREAEHESGRTRPRPWRSGLSFNDRPDEARDRHPHLVALDLDEVPGEIVAPASAHTVPNFGVGAVEWAIFHLGQKIGGGQAEALGQQHEPRRTDPVGAALVFLHLLIGDAQTGRELLLSEAEGDPTGANAFPDPTVDLLLVASDVIHGNPSLRPGMASGGRGGSWLLSPASLPHYLFRLPMSAIDLIPWRILPALRALLLIFCIGSLAACSGTDEPDYVERPVDELYNEAQDNLEAGEYLLAAQAFEEVDRQHPYSQWATRAQLMAAYAYYEANAYDEAIAAAERFVELHPGHPDAPYGYYLIGVSYYEQISDVRRDQEMTENALASLREVVRRFPQSDYARDAQLKLDLALDHLAGKEMEIGRWYQRRGEYVAAINRFRSVVENYQTTTHLPEALHRLTESYLALGVTEEAETAAAVLGYNYPGSEWYVKSYALLTGEDLAPRRSDGSRLSRIF
jgi:outer membrane protein assembly factor BamD